MAYQQIETEKKEIKVFFGKGTSEIPANTNDYQMLKPIATFESATGVSFLATLHLVEKAGKIVLVKQHWADRYVPTPYLPPSVIKYFRKNSL